MAVHIEIARGQSAGKLLQDSHFLSGWERLVSLCPWATSFQGPRYGRTWYKCYEDSYEPFLLYLIEKDELQGLLALAVQTNDGSLVNMGGRQSEYHTWICLQNLARAFPLNALRAIQQNIPVSRLVFRYLPPGTPLDWVVSMGSKSVYKLDAQLRPLLRFGDGSEIKKSLGKKSNRSRLNRLGKIGPVEFQKINAEEFERYGNDIIDFYDFRQGAVHNILPFRSDENKRQFHQAMLKSDGLLHATILRVGDRLASAHLGMVNGKEVQLGVIVHNPLLSRYSPGKFHVFFLAQMLQKHGYEQLDLTPGGDPYKERFANAHDKVHTLTVYPSLNQRLREKLQNQTADAGRALLRSVHISPKFVKKIVNKARKIHPVRTPPAALGMLYDGLFRRREMCIYRYSASRAPEERANNVIARDCIADLLNYQPAENGQSKRRFLSNSLKRLENGLHVYTCSEEGQLLHYGWMIERQEKSFIREVCQEYHFPPNTTCLYDFYTFPKARGRGLYTSSVLRMLRDAALIPGTEWVYVAVLADNCPSRHVIEKIGFSHAASLYEEVRFGRVKRWSHEVPVRSPECLEP